MRALLGKYGLALVLVWVYLYSFPYFAKIQHANELPRVYLTMAIADEGTLAIDTGVKRWGVTADVSVAYGHSFSNKAPGSSFLAVPGYYALKGVNALFGRGEPSLAEITWVCRVTAAIIPNLLFLILLFRFLTWFVRRYDGPAEESGEDSGGPAPTRAWQQRDAVRLAVCGYGLGSLALVYAIQFMANQLSAVCIGTAYILSVWVLEDDRDPRLLWLAGLAAGCALLVDYQAVFAGVPLAVYLLVKLGRERRYKHLAFAVLGAVPPIVALLLYHNECFGSPLKTGYDFSQTFAHFHQKGFLGITRLRWEAFYGATFLPENGLYIFCPMLLLAFYGWYLMVRRRLYWQLFITLSTFIIYLAFISSINFWRGGWQVGPRYITAMLPFVMVPVAVALSYMSRHFALRGLAVALVATGIVIYAVSAALFPHFPERFDNPLYELVWQLLVDDRAPYNLGYALGLRGLSSLVPLFVVLSGALVWLALGPSPGLSADGGDARGGVVGALRRRLAHWRSALIGALGAVGILASYSLFDGAGREAVRAYRFVIRVFPT